MTLLSRTTRGIGAALAAVVVTQIALPVHAEEQEGKSPNEIVVSGVADQPERREKFATDVSTSYPSTPLALYEPGDYCPGVVGLSSDRNRAIAERMRRVAGEAGMQPAEGECQTSALVLFADDRADLLKRFRKMHPEYFLKLTDETIDFQGRDDSVMAWQLLARVDRNGVPVAVEENGIQIVAVTSGMTRLEAASRPVVAMTVLLIERSAVRGLTTQQIADFALMRTIVDRAPSSLRADAMSTILKVIDAPLGAETPLSLTSWDLTYAKSRYAVNRWNYGPSQMAAIRTAMNRSADAEN